VEELLGALASATTVSRICCQLKDRVRAWHRRALKDEYIYLILDGVSLRVKEPLKAGKRICLCVYGITAEGRREIIDFRLAKSESEAEWTILLEDVRRRGLKGYEVQLAVTDGGQGLINALQMWYFLAFPCSAAGRTS
jgi:transposase-like protein